MDGGEGGSSGSIFLKMELVLWVMNRGRLIEKRLSVWSLRSRILAYAATSSNRTFVSKGVFMCKVLLVSSVLVIWDDVSGWWGIIRTWRIRSSWLWAFGRASTVSFASCHCRNPKANVIVDRKWWHSVTTCHTQAKPGCSTCFKQRQDQAASEEQSTLACLNISRSWHRFKWESVFDNPLLLRFS